MRRIFCGFMVMMAGLRCARAQYGIGPESLYAQGLKTNMTAAAAQAYLQVPSTNSLFVSTNNIATNAAAQLTIASNTVLSIAAGSLGVLQYSRFAGLTQNTNLVPVSTYAGTAQAGTTNSGPGGGGAVTWWAITTNQTSRIRQNGDIKGAQIYLPSTAGMSSFAVDVWKRTSSGTNWDLWGSSTNLLPSITGGALATVLFNITNAAVGDFVGWHATWSAAAPDLFSTNSLAGYQTTSTPGTTNVAWSTFTRITSAVPVVLLGRAPMIVGIGDSTLSGHAVMDSYADVVNTLDGDPNAGMFQIVVNALGVTGQNMGIGSQQSGAVVTRLTADVISLHPRACLVIVGNNDLPSVVTNVMVSNASSIIASLVSAGIIPIYGTINGCYGSSDCNTLGQLTNLVTFNAVLTALTNTYPTLVVADANPFLSQFVPGGPVGNLGQQQTAVGPGDFIHYNAYGESRWAAGILRAILPSTFAGDLVAGALLSMSDIRIDGRSGRAVEMVRQPSYQQPGSNLVVRAGGAYIGGTNLAGGSLDLSGGITTGNGTNAINLKTAAPGASGSADNIPATQVQVTQDGHRAVANNIAQSGEIVAWWVTGADGKVSSMVYTNGMFGISAPGFPDVPVIWLNTADGNAYIGAQGSATGNATLNVLRGGNSYDQNHALARFDAVVGEGLRFGHMTDSHRSWIAGAQDGIAWDDLVLEPFAGSVLVGATNNWGAWIFQVTGNALVTGTLTASNGAQIKGGLTIFSGGENVTGNSAFTGTGTFSGAFAGGTATASIGGTHIFRAAAGNPNDQGSDIMEFTDSSGVNGIWFGADTTTHDGLMGAFQRGTAHRPLHIDPHAAQVTIGATTTTNGNGAELQITGNLDTTGTVFAHNGANIVGTLSSTNGALFPVPAAGVTATSGSNARYGIATMTSGVVTIANTTVSASDHVTVTIESGTGASSEIIPTYNAGVSLVLTATVSSSGATDTTANYHVFWILTKLN